MFNLCLHYTLKQTFSQFSAKNHIKALAFLCEKAYSYTIKRKEVKRMTIDIKPSQGKWWVIAHLPSGKAHDSFDTQTEALAFALDFYGGQVVSVMGVAA